MFRKIKRFELNRQLSTTVIFFQHLQLLHNILSTILLGTLQNNPEN